MMHTVRTLVTVLALGLPIAGVADAKKPRTPQKDPVSAFLKQDAYTYCDVKLLAAMWNQSIRESKARVGVKLQANAQASLNSELEAARERVWKRERFARQRGQELPPRCTYVDAGLSYEDVEKLAAIWKTSVADAKIRIGQSAQAGGVGTLRAQLGGAAAFSPQPGSGAPAQTSDAGLATFLKQDTYRYCDAKMLARMWKRPIRDAKAFIGEKIQSNSQPALERTLGDSRAFARKNPSARCAFLEAFSPQDVAVLAKRWRVTPPQAKAIAENKLLAGGEGGLHLLLAAARRDGGAPPPRIAPPPPPPPPRRT